MLDKNQLDRLDAERKQMRNELHPNRRLAKNLIRAATLGGWILVGVCWNISRTKGGGEIAMLIVPPICAFLGVNWLLRNAWSLIGLSVLGTAIMIYRYDLVVWTNNAQLPIAALYASVTIACVIIVGAFAIKGIESAFRVDI